MVDPTTGVPAMAAIIFAALSVVPVTGVVPVIIRIPAFMMAAVMVPEALKVFPVPNVICIGNAP